MLEKLSSLETLGLYDMLGEIFARKKDLAKNFSQKPSSLEKEQRIAYVRAVASDFLDTIDNQKILGKQLYTYHHKAHTTQQVVPESLRLFGEQNILFSEQGKQLLTQEDEELLTLAAWFHDAGFLLKYIDNERIGAEIVARTMHHMGCYTPEQIARVAQLIMATQVHREAGGRLVQSAPEGDILAQVLCDADLAHWAKDMTVVQSTLDALIQEKQQCGQIVDPDRMYAEQAQVMEKHTYLSPAGQVLLTPVKEENIAEWRDLKRKIV